MLDKIAENKLRVSLLFVCFFAIVISINAQVPDPNQGLRADWMKGSWGALWLPERNYNQNIEGVRIDDFLSQIEDIRTIDYIQVPLTSPNIFSPVHTGPHDIIESLWQGDTGANDEPINLVVPINDDPLFNWLTSIRAAGLKSEIYVNSYNLLDREPDNIPDDYPDVPQRWKNYCDTNAEAQNFINNHPYISADDPENRRYMFCYAEFILKEYAIRYGDLIDAWCFDSADNIMEVCGDNADNGLLEDQRIYQAFADALHVGNPNAAVSFNNSVGTDTAPFSTATLFDDYTFGHPFGGAGNMVVPEILYTRNFGICEFMQETNGLPFTEDNRDWNDNVVGHFFPKQSTTSWNAGATPCLTDDQFVEWTSTAITNAGAVSWGTPLVRTNLENAPILILQPYALTQLSLTDISLKEFQSPGVPNWSRQSTPLTAAYVGQTYAHELIEGHDFWDPEDDAIIALVAQGDFPAWLTVTETEPGIWTLSGTPNETTDTDYEFSLQVSDASGSSQRVVNLEVFENYVPESPVMDVEIIATNNTNYGIDNIATMFSDIQTAPDGLATYRVSVEVTPPSGQAIISGTSGGVSTARCWGIGDGTDSNQDVTFRGSDNEWVENINTIEIIDFDANGGDLLLDEFSANFKSITIVNAQSTNDAVSVSDGNITSNVGKLPYQSHTIDLFLEFFDESITEFRVGTSNNSQTNRWSVDNMIVEVSFNNIISNVETTAAPDDSFKVFPNPAKGTVFLNIPIYGAQLIDVSGRIVKEYANGTQELDISNFISGIYFLKGMSADGNILFQRIIKK